MIESQCQPLIEKFRREYVLKNPNKQYNYLVDIYIKWYRNYLYFCEKYKSEDPNRSAIEFENTFVRLKSTKIDRFDFSYMRHTGRWVLVAHDLTLSDCLEMMHENPVFQPSG